MTITTCAPTISSSGISAPAYADVLAYLQAKFQSIYGADVYLGSDSQDGQFIAVIAQAISDVNAACVGVYNQFSPQSAVGTGLSSVVKVNGINRAASSYSTVDLTIVGQPGTGIANGIVTDVNSVKWDLPSPITIPSAGQIVVTATCESAGAVNAVPGSVTTISTPTLGWQSVTNVSAASPGSAVETDGTLRLRQATSTAIPSLTVFEGIIGAVANVSGVTRYIAYENDTDATDANGIPANRIAFVVEGGDATDIANAIGKKKVPGGGTFGTTNVTITNVYGIPVIINFFRPTDLAVGVSVSFKALPGYTSQIGALAQAAVADYINGVAIGGGIASAVEWDECISAVKGVVGGNTMKIISLTLSAPGAVANPDIPLLFNQAATCSAATVILTPAGS